MSDKLEAWECDVCAHAKCTCHATPPADHDKLNCVHCGMGYEDCQPPMLKRCCSDCDHATPPPPQDDEFDPNKTEYPPKPSKPQPDEVSPLKKANDQAKQDLKLLLGATRKNNV